MQRAARAFALVAITLVGVWGCSQSPANRTVLLDRIRSLEEKNARIEEEMRTTVAVRDQVKTQLARAEEQIEKLQKVVKERDDLKVLVKARTGERDQVATQYEQFRKSVKELVGQADAAVLRFPDGEPVTVSVNAGPAPKSNVP